MRKAPTKPQIKKWVRALRSGKYKQGTGALQSGKNQFCCLGVAVKEFVPKREQVLSANGFLAGGVANSQPSPEWLVNINRNFGNKTFSMRPRGIEPWSITLVTMNDKMKLTFNEIADCLEATYILGVLDA